MHIQRDDVSPHHSTMAAKRKLSAATAASSSDKFRYGEATDDTVLMPGDLPGQDRDHHFQQLYAKPPDFKALAMLDSEFAAVCVGTEHICVCIAKEIGS